MRTRYTAVAQTLLVRSGPVRTGTPGSSTLSAFRDQLICVHAVRPAEDGPRSRAACGWDIGGGKILDQEWPAVPRASRCPACHRLTGDVPSTSGDAPTDSAATPPCARPGLSHAVPGTNGADRGRVGRRR